MAATPFISFLGPSNLDGYNRSLPPAEQPANIPKVFLDAMEVREKVFVHEQGVALNNEFDSDDARACHWVHHRAVTSTLIWNSLQYRSYMHQSTKRLIRR